MKSEFLHIRISPELKEQLKEAADNDMRSISEYVLKAINEAIKRDKKRGN